MALDMSKFIGRFVEEAREHVSNLNKGLLTLEKNPTDSETINSIFRSAHTVKGSSRMLKLMEISNLAHKLEDALGALRDGKIGFAPELSGVLFKGIDTIAAMVEKTAAGEELTEDNTGIIKLIEQAAAGELTSGSVENLGKATAPKKHATIEPTDAATAKAESVEAAATAPEKAKPSAKVVVEETVRISTDKLNELIRLASEISSSHSRLKQRHYDVHGLSKLTDELSKIAMSHGNGNGDSHAGVVLQKLSESISSAAKKVSSSLKDDLALHELLMRDLQERTLKMRMLPLSTIFDSFHMTVREIAASFGKSISLNIEGAETEMDKKIIEKMSDPLVHMFRNAIDHGIESPDERMKAGKPAKGTIRLSAGYEGGSVIIIMSDDGRGISTEKIKKKALQRGLVNEEMLSTMSEAELRNLIFLPGFSTSPIITDVSGRGVGMDVVKKNIVESLKGAIDIETEEGVGTTFYIRLPMTLAIMHVMLVDVAGIPFALPDSYVGEILKVKETDIIDVVDKKAVNVREQLVPVEDLNALLGLPDRNIGGGDLLLMIVKVGAERLGLVVDAILDKEDMVIKSLPLHMKRLKMVSGVIITGKNQVVNVLNVPSLVLAAKETKGTLRKREKAQAAERQINVLVVDDSINTREIEKSILEAYGYKVTLASDGAEAFEKAKKIVYDVVISDVEMPIMDGFSLTQRLRAEEAYVEVPIILLTSRDKEEDKRRGIQVGASAYIVKGDFEQSNLIETIQNLVI